MVILTAMAPAKCLIKVLGMDKDTHAEQFHLELMNAVRLILLMTMVLTVS